VDIHVFARDAEDVIDRVRALGWTYEVQRVSIVKQGRVLEFVHVLVADVFPIELTVYAPRDLGTRPRSSTDGKPIVRLKSTVLRTRMAREHPSEWARYLADGEVPDMQEILAMEEGEDDEIGGSPDGEEGHEGEDGSVEEAHLSERQDGGGNHTGRAAE
jgi:hypothetical protein